LSSSAKADDPVNLRRVGQSQPLGLLDARFRGHDKGHVGPKQINKYLTKQVRPPAPDSFLFYRTYFTFSGSEYRPFRAAMVLHFADNLMMRDKRQPSIRLRA
jgi:hypothetical protein